MRTVFRSSCCSWFVLSSRTWVQHLTSREPMSFAGGFGQRMEKGPELFQHRRLWHHDIFCNMSCCQELCVALHLQQVKQHFEGPVVMQCLFYTTWPHVSFSMFMLWFCCEFLYSDIWLGLCVFICHFTSMHLWLPFQYWRVGALKPEVWYCGMELGEL